MYYLLSSLKSAILPLSEQIKIANFLSALDQRIGLEKKKLDELQRFKRGLIEKMFI